MADMRIIHRCDPIVKLNDARKHIPDWRYLKGAQGQVNVPREHLPTMFKLMGFDPETGMAVKRVKPGTASGTETSTLEGTVYERLSKHRSRDPNLRRDKIASLLRLHGRLACEVPGCGFDFASTYGDLGRGYAHIHHMNPLAYGERETTLEDLAVVCANCHAMIHHKGKCRPLRGLIK